MKKYADLVKQKRKKAQAIGFIPDLINDQLYDWQKEIVKWACRKGRAALFEDCGLGKTRQQLAWADCVHRHVCNSHVLILAPLAVAEQTCREGRDIGINCAHVKDPAELDKPGIYITNYERAERFLDHNWAGLVLDESSIIKSQTGRTRTMLIEAAQAIPYRLACTATPAPNDHMELGQHAEFLGVCTAVEMMATYFVNDAATTQKWRLKGHAVDEFWQWVASWAIMMRNPTDIGFACDGYDLPELNIHNIEITTDHVPDDSLVAIPAMTLSDQREARRVTMESRCKVAADMVNNSDDQWLVWCELNDESGKLNNLINDACEVAGSTDHELKSRYMLDFASGDERVLITKPKIAGFGMNWQACHNMVFVGLSHSWEQYYQAVRRCWRHGQTKPVNVYIINTDLEDAVVQSIKTKQQQNDDMAEHMIKSMKGATMEELHNKKSKRTTYKTETQTGNNWTMHLGDCVETITNMDNDSIDYSVFSPPFASLYTYSDSEYDMGNCTGDDEFMAQFQYLVDQLFRTIKPGRLVSFHCMNLPTSKVRDGYIGINDFRGNLIKQFQDVGFIYHSEVCIWKDPVVAMQRTKALGLLHKTIRKDSSMSRQGIPDYLVTMRKPGENAEPIKHAEDLPVDLWQKYASPIWMDIKQGDTLQHRSAREHKDEKHICPLQLEVIKRALHLWSNPGDLVLSPFGGIGSEGYESIKNGRKFVGCELKKSYFDQACKNLANAEVEASMQTSFLGMI